MSVTSLAEHWKTMKKSEAAVRGEDLDALKAMQHDALALLAWEALNTIEALNEYEYLRGALEDELEGPGDFQFGWVIAQSVPGGGWSKWSKAVGGYVFNQSRYGVGELTGDAMIYFSWKAAKAAFNTMYKDDDDVAACMKIYPIVVTAGREPRLTIPREEQKP